MATNQYWTDLHAAAEAGDYLYDPGTRIFKPNAFKQPMHKALIDRYSPTITDPPVVDLIANRTYADIVMPDAGTGYWAYLLAGYGKRVTAYDLSPTDRRWHPVLRLDWRRSSLKGPHDSASMLIIGTRFPFSDALKAIRSWRGTHLILVCNQPHVGRQLSEVLQQSWVATGQPWWTASFADEPRQVYEFTRFNTDWLQATMKLPIYGEGATQ